MPVYARRRLQAMLNDLAPLLTVQKAADLLARLEHKNAKDALAAEVELSLLWSIQRVADLEIDPVLEGSSARPDAFTRTLFPRGPALVEITAVSDDTFSGHDWMNRAADKVGHFCNRHRKRSSSHLYFRFLEARKRDQGQLRRVRRITKDFELTPAFESKLKEWVSAPEWPNPPSLQLTDEQIDVVIEWRKYVHPEGRVFSSMPPVADHLEDNPVYGALRAKERQLSKSAEGVLKCIFLADAGCHMLRELRPLGGFQVSGEQVINYFLARSKIDLVCVFSPYRAWGAFMAAGSSSPRWRVTLFEKEMSADRDVEHERLNRIALGLPQPQLEAYQARSWHRQGLFDPQAKGIYLGTSMSSKGGINVSISISSRMVLELLAGRITQEQFQNCAFGRNDNLFEHQLKSGFTIQAARLEKGGLDEDDDKLVFELEPDWGARPLHNPKL